MHFRSPDDNGGGDPGQTTQTPPQTTPTTPVVGSNSDAARAADFQSQLDRYNNDALRMAEKYHERNYQLRQRAQEAEAKLPTDKQKVISLDEANILAEYKKLGTVEEIGNRTNELFQLQRYQQVSEAAGIAQMNPKVLSKLLTADDVLEIGEAKNDEGQSERVVRVKKEGNDPVLLQNYAESNWSEFLPALMGQQQEPAGRPWIPQASAGSEGPNGQNQVAKAKMEQIKARAKRSETPIF